MGKRDLMMRRNQHARRVEQSTSMHRNCIRLHPQNTVEHEMKKVEICWNLLQEGKEFITEAKFRDRDIRADIFVLDDGTMYEIESSEYELEDRKAKYPDEDIEVILLDEEDTNIGDLL